MVRVVLIPLLLLGSTACGVIVPYLHDAGRLDDRLVVTMPKAQVLNELGAPDRVVQDNGRQIVWEYRLYVKDEWKAYLIHCPFHPFCYFPAEPPLPYYVALHDDQLCMWGTPDVVRTLAWKICGTGMTTRRIYRAGGNRLDGRLHISVIPVFMPPLLSSSIQRLAVIPLDDGGEDRVASWLDLTLNLLRSRRPQLVLVERETMQPIMQEVGIQYTGRVDDDTTARIGKLVGADSLLTYRVTVPSDKKPASVSIELRLLKVESGTTLFRQITTAAGAFGEGKTGAALPDEANQIAHRVLVEEAIAFGLAALRAAFGENPLGIVPDHTWPDEGVKVLGLLHGGPAHRAGLKPGDRILAFDGRVARNWTDAIVLPALLAVERDGEVFETRLND